jgi:DNA-binding NtrC family response regulator
MSKIVIIDDEAPILELMGKLVRSMGHEPYLYQTGREGVDALERLKPELLIVDLRIGDMNGLQIIQDARARHQKTEVVMVTGYGSVETAVEAMKLGAFDYLTKPFELDDLKRTINRAVKKEDQVSMAVQEPTLRPADANTVVGDSSQIREVLRMAEKIANNDSPCLIEGEFGSGKQMIARTVHNLSRRATAPFKVLHCSALPEDLLELELFGSSAGATHTIFSRAQGGTVVLEEINYLPQRLQSQLDSFLEEVGGRRMSGGAKGADFRLIATSSIPLEKLVKDGKFREDLYYRLSVIPVNLPPLRSRRDDIPLLANHFLKNYARLTNTPPCEVDKYAMDLLTAYNWPGNVGELQNAIERACVIAEKGRIRPADLPPKVTNKVEVREDEGTGRVSLPIGTSLNDFIKKQEKLFIRETLKFNEGSREKTATMLGVSIATLYRKMGLKLERDKMMG